MSEAIKKAKSYNAEQIDVYSKNIREHVAEYGLEPCDYLTYRREMLMYYKGAWNALNELKAN